MSICSGVPYSAMRLALPIVRNEYDDMPALAAWNHDCAARLTTVGNCIPPSDSSNEPAPRPALMNSAMPDWISSGKTTAPSSPT
ncbi:Uncharacterised protein [Mycobacteroides abscessus subsp. abscessus]|nr:Uncharacterised protein [Mycobacteroides abscessus subsp. abscessus]